MTELVIHQDVIALQSAQINTNDPLLIQLTLDTSI